MTMNIGLIGYGTIGRMLAQAIRDGLAGDVSLVAIKDIFDEPPFEAIPGGPTYTSSIDFFLSLDMDLVVEAACQAMLKEYAPLVLKSGKSLIAMSVGALVDTAFLEQIKRLTSQHNCRVFIPSGAIGGLDAISAAGIDAIDEVTLTSVKPVRALEGVQSAVDPHLDLDALTAPTCLYEGPAEEAVTRFPLNINVAAALSLAGVGFEKTTVRLVADPQGTHNVHRIEARGAFGELKLEFKNNPSPTNPKTSYLAALSAIRLVKNLTESIKVGS
jgi:aspartate dehydrogenase